jgi:hypothetical protein
MAHLPPAFEWHWKKLITKLLEEQQQSSEQRPPEPPETLLTPMALPPVPETEEPLWNPPLSPSETNVKLAHRALQHLKDLNPDSKLALSHLYNLHKSGEMSLPFFDTDLVCEKQEEGSVSLSCFEVQNDFKSDSELQKPFENLIQVEVFKKQVFDCKSFIVLY